VTAWNLTGRSLRLAMSVIRPPAHLKTCLLSRTWRSVYRAYDSDIALVSVSITALSPILLHTTCPHDHSNFTAKFRVSQITNNRACNNGDVHNTMHYPCFCKETRLVRVTILCLRRLPTANYGLLIIHHSPRHSIL
jgi:hypothetical protein